MKKIAFFALFSLIICSCGLFKYGSAVADDSYNLRIKNRKFIKELHFVGVIKNKFLGNRDTKYRLLIGNFKNKYIVDTCHSMVYYSYYSFDCDTLEIAVSKELYHEVKVGDVVNKVRYSDSVIVNNKSFLFHTW